MLTLIIMQGYNNKVIVIYLKEDIKTVCQSKWAIS